MGMGRRSCVLARCQSYEADESLPGPVSAFNDLTRPQTTSFENNVMQHPHKVGANSAREHELNRTSRPEVQRAPVEEKARPTLHSRLPQTPSTAAGMSVPYGQTNMNRLPGPQMNPPSIYS